MSITTWRTSSYSGAQNNCVEVAMTWRTSSYSGSENNCVEVALAAEETGIRDTKDRDGGALSFGRDAFAAFLARAKSGGAGLRR